MSGGTPLRKVGKFQVFQMRRGVRAWWEIRDEGGQRVYSNNKDSANYAVERLGAGQYLQSPRECLEQSMVHYPGLYPTRFDYVDHIYITNGNGMDWVNGGLTHTDVTLITESGRAQHAAEQKARREAEKAHYRKHGLGTDSMDAVDREMDAEDEEIRALFRDGQWPDAATDENLRGHRKKMRELDLQVAALTPDAPQAPKRPLNVMYPPCQYACLAELAAGAIAAPEWAEDARQATVILLTHAQNDPERPSENAIETVSGWARTLAARFGGVWLPPGMV